VPTVFTGIVLVVVKLPQFSAPEIVALELVVKIPLYFKPDPDNVILS
jgi:hypothetical protein